MDFWRFSNSVHRIPLHHDHNHWLVLGSVAIAILAASILLPVIRRASDTRNEEYRIIWRLVGAVGMGIGIWCMHFTGMLAMTLPVAVGYDPLITLLSVLPAIAGSWLSMIAINDMRPSQKRLHLGAASLALGIGTMHYLGMEALVTTAIMRYDPLLFALSIIAAYMLAGAGLHLYTKIGGTTLRFGTFIASIPLGLAVAAMHYVAMTATLFYAAAEPADINIPGTGLLGTELIGAASIILAIILISSIVDERQKRILDQLDGSNSRFLALVDSIPDAALIVDSKMRIDSANAAVSTVFGCEKSRYIGQPVSNLLGTDAMAAVRGALQHTDDRKPVTECRRGGIRADGRHFPAEIIAAGFTMGEETFLSVLVRNIEERIERERHLRQAQRIESMAQMAAGLAHEINTPAQYTRDNIEFISESWQTASDLLTRVTAMMRSADQYRLPDTLYAAFDKADFDYLKEEVPAALDACAAGIHKISDIVSAVHTVTNTEERGDAKRADINESVAQVIDEARQKWASVAFLSADLGSDISEAMLVVGRFREVLHILICNAAHAIEDAGRERGNIIIRTDECGGKVRVHVEDNGCGIPEANLERIYDHFFTTKEPGRGTGQGMSIARAIVCDTHNGEISVNSVENVGTKVTVSFPALSYDRHEADRDDRRRARHTG